MIQRDFRDMPPVGTRPIDIARRPRHFNFEIVLLDGILRGLSLQVADFECSLLGG
jgi:hypothetical protein